MSVLTLVFYCFLLLAVGDHVLHSCVYYLLYSSVYYLLFWIVYYWLGSHQVSDNFDHFAHGTSLNFAQHQASLSLCNNIHKLYSVC